MDSAQDKITGEIVEAEQLWLIPEVDKDRYVCRGCGIKLTPAAYRPENVVRPYFTARDGDHKLGCDVNGEKKLVTKGKKNRVSTPKEGFPAPYPSKLVLRDLRAITGEPGGGDNDGTGGSGTRRRGDGERGTSTSNRRRVANTIRRICRTFINFPYDRDLELEVPGIDATKYLSVFKKLKWDELARYPDTRIFYAAIRWSKPLETDEFLEVTVDAGERDQEKRLARGHRVRVEWADWSKAKRTYVRNEIEAARKEAIAAKDKETVSKRPGGAVNLRGELLTSGIGTTETEEMAKPIIDDELWTLIEPLLPPPKPRREKNPGRLPVSNRAALTGILFVLKTGLRWRDLPAEMGCGSGVTCWRRLRDWQAAGVWDRLHELLLAKLRAADQIDFSRAAVDSSSIRAVGAGQKLGQTPPIARDQVLSTTSSPTPMARRSRRS